MIKHSTWRPILHLKHLVRLCLWHCQTPCPLVAYWNGDVVVFTIITGIWCNRRTFAGSWFYALLIALYQRISNTTSKCSLMLLFFLCGHCSKNLADNSFSTGRTFAKLIYTIQVCVISNRIIWQTIVNLSLDKAVAIKSLQESGAFSQYRRHLLYLAISAY